MGRKIFVSYKYADELVEDLPSVFFVKTKARHYVDHVAESWSRGAQWAIGRLEYPGYLGGPTSLPNYTQICIDLIDAPINENNNGLSIQQGDSVTGYTIRQIENSLIGVRKWNDWRDEIINDHNNATENEVSELFDLWN